MLCFILESVQSQHFLNALTIDLFVYFFPNDLSKSDLHLRMIKCRNVFQGHYTLSVFIQGF